MSIADRWLMIGFCRYKLIGNRKSPIINPSDSRFTINEIECSHRLRHTSDHIAGEIAVGNKLLTVFYALGVIAAFLVLQAFLRTSGAVVRAEVPTANQRSAATLYSKHCASCHGKDGRSKTFKAKFNHARNLTEPGWQDAVSDERIFNSIANGRGGKMPAFAKKMNEAEIDSLVLLVRGLKRG